MGPALQRLLRRPAALSVLRALTEATTPESASRLCQCRGYATKTPTLRAPRRLRDLPPPELQGRTEVVVSSPSPDELPDDARIRLSTFSQLRYESDLTSQDGLGSRLVDRYPQNATLLVVLLQFRKRLSGTEGIHEFWQGLKMRQIDLPVDGSKADILWRTLLQSGMEHATMLDEITKHNLDLKKHQGQGWSGLYEAVIGLWLQQKPRTAVKWHNRLKRDFPPTPAALASLAKTAFATTASTEEFFNICADGPMRGLYSIVIPILCAQEQYAHAFKWHNMLMQQGDYPPTSACVEPLMFHLALFGQEAQLKSVTRNLLEAGVPFHKFQPKKPEKSSTAARSSEVVNRIMGDAFAIAPKPYNDRFCARLFATRSFSVEFIINGMEALGVGSIGPDAVRELAAREMKSEAILERLQQLKRAYISMAPSKISRLIEKFALEGRDDLLETLIMDDQHSDALENDEIQEKLLARYLKKGKRRNLEKTLEVLSAFTEDPARERANALLRGHISNHNFAGAMSMIGEMRKAAIPITVPSSRLFLRHTLRWRLPGHRAVSELRGGESDDLTQNSLPTLKGWKGGDHDLGVSINFMIGALHSGDLIPPESWQEIFTRLGQTGRLDELERLALWLATFYAPSTADEAKARTIPSRLVKSVKRDVRSTAHVPANLPTSHPAHPLSIIFSTGFQRSVVAWPFITGKLQVSRALTTPTSAQIPSRAISRSPPWTRGLILLKALQQRGVVLQPSAIRKAYQLRLVALYGPGRSHRPINRLQKRTNRVSIDVMLEDAKMVWGDNILTSLPRTLLPSLSRPLLESIVPRVHHLGSDLSGQSERIAP